MAQDVANAAKVGLLAVTLVGAAYGGYRFVSRDVAGGGYRVYTLLPDVTGVAPRSRVMISGIQVGTVSRISLTEDGRARVDIQMNPDVPLYEDATAGKRSTSLIGEYFVVLSPGTTGKTQIPDGGEIRTTFETPSIEGLENQVSDILKDVKKVTESLKNTVGSDKGQKDIEKILDQIASVSKELNEAVKENRKGVRDTIDNVNKITGQSAPEIKAILENVKQATGDVRELLAKAPTPEGKSGEARSTLEKIDRASSSLESTLKHADSIAAQIDSGKGNVGRLVKDETLINEVESAVQNVGDLLGGIGRLQTIVTLRSDYNFLSNTIKNYVQLRLQPSEDKYYMIELVSDPRGVTTFQQIDVETTNPNDPPHYREIRTITTDSLRFSAQFAKRFGPLTGRFGILESTGGIGLDLNLLDNRFELRQDLFGFGEQLGPRWRIAVGYEFLRKLWLLGGVDDVFSDARRDYFVGVQIRFNDLDLKSILPFAPIP